MSIEKTELTPKSRVLDDADVEERTGESGGGVPDFDGSNLVIPTPLSRSSSKKSASQSSLSSPKPLLSAQNDDSTADSCNPETADRMDLDDTSPRRNVMILDTSRASWNKPVGLIATPQPQPPQSLPSKSDSGDHGHVRKKRKSDIELVPPQDDISMNCQSDDGNLDCGRTSRENERMPLQNFLSKKSGKLPAAPRKVQKDSRQNLRSHIVGFAVRFLLSQRSRTFPKKTKTKMRTNSCLMRKYPVICRPTKAQISHHRVSQAQMWSSIFKSQVLLFSILWI